MAFSDSELSDLRRSIQKAAEQCENSLQVAERMRLSGDSSGVKFFEDCAAFWAHAALFNSVHFSYVRRRLESAR